MATTWKAPTWRMPNEKNQNKFESYSLDFDSAISNYINCGGQSIFNGLTAFSISCWIKRNGTQQSYAAVLSYQTSTSQYLKLNFNTYTDKIEMAIRPGTTSVVKVTSSAGSIPDGEWVHIAVVGDANNLSNLNMYINGVLDNDVTSGNITTLAQSSSSDIHIGTDAGNPSAREFKGEISQTCIFDYALSSTQVSSLYNSGSPINPMTLKPAPVAYYPLGVNASTGGDPLTATTPNTLSVPNIAVPDASVFDFVPSDNIATGDSFGNILGDNYTGDVSFSFWYNADANSGIFSLGNGSSYGELHAQIVSGKLSWGINNDVWRRITSTSLGLNTWNHIVLIYKNGSESGSKIYVNGSEASTTTAGGAFPTSNLDFAGKLLNIGSFWVFNYDGELSNFQAWNTELTSSEVTILYNSGVPLLTGTQPQASNLKAWYKLDQSANWEADTAGNWQIPDAVSSYPQSFDFDGSDDFVSTNFNVDNYTNLTYSVWVNPTSLNQRGGLASLSSVNNFVAAFWDGSGGKFYVYIGNVLSQITGIWSGSKFGTLGQEKWLHIAVVYDGSGATDADRLKVYADGDYVAFNSLGSIPTSIPSGGGDLIIGKWTTAEYDGKMSNVMLFDSSLPETGSNSIETLYNDGVPLTTAIATDNLKAWYKLNDNEKFDGINWSVENQKYPANWESALYFDGTNAVDLPTIDFDMTNNLTLSCWINPAGFSTWDYLCTRGGAGGANSALNFRFSAAGRLYSSYLGSSLDTAVVFPTNQWSHLAITFNYSTGDVIFYKNGIQTGNTLTFANGYATAGLSNIGDVNGTGSSGMNALISNFAVWESLQDISELYNDGTPATSYTNTPTAWWKLNNLNTGLIDNGTGGNNATNVGTVQANTFVSTEAGTSSGMTEQNLVNNNVSALNGESSGMDTSNLVTSTLTRQIPYNSYSLNFDSVSDFINCGNSSIFDITSTITVSAWIKAGSSGWVASFPFFVQKGTNISYMLFGRQVSSTSLLPRLRIGVNGDPNMVEATTSVNSTDWHHILGTFDGSTMKIYVNGQLDNSKSLSQSIPTGTDNLTIGGVSGGGTSGLISNVSIFDEELTSTEVMKLYNSGVPSDLSNFTPSPIAWWSLGSDSYFNGTSYICPDLINTNNGTSSGMDANALIGDAPNSSANGTSTNMTIDANLTGNAPNSSNNSFSVNMSYDDRVSGSGNVPE